MLISPCVVYLRWAGNRPSFTHMVLHSRHFREIAAVQLSAFSLPRGEEGFFFSPSQERGERIRVECERGLTDALVGGRTLPAEREPLVGRG